MTKRARQEQIAGILRQGPVRGQDELVRRLRAQRVRVSQATLSRDLRELGIARGPGGYALPGSASLAGPPVAPATEARRLLRELRETVRSVAPAASLVVIRTDPGHAHHLGVALDHSEWPEIVGTIAGDDTLFVATSDRSVAERLAHRIRTAIA